MPSSQPPVATEVSRRDDAFERSSTGLLVADLDGVITSSNAAMAALIGLPPARVAGMNLLELLDPPEQICDLLDGLVTTGAVDEHVVSLHGGAGARRIALTAALLPLAGASGTQQFLATGRQLDRPRHAPGVLDGASVAAAAAHIGGLVAHDLNNVLAVLLGACHLLATSSLNDAAARRDVDSLVAASGEAALIVRQLAACGAARPSQPVPIDPAEALQRLTPTVSGLTATAVDLDVTAASVGGTLMIDPATFDDVVLSLALEARRTLATDARVRLRLTPSSAGDEWRLRLSTCVPDGGDRQPVTGCSADNDAARAPRRGPIAVERWVADHGGRLAIDSGTAAFSAEVAWPRQVDVDRAATPAPPPAMVTGATTVLVVDDNVRLRRFVEHVLIARGYAVVAVGNGSSALDAIAARRFDAVVTDIFMPDVSGWTVGEAVRQQDPGCGVVYVTGELAAGDGVDARAAGCHVLMKPFTTARLLDAVARACTRPAGV